MKEAGLVCVLQVGRGWLRELVPMFDDGMRKQGVKRKDSGQEGRGGEAMGPTALKYLLNKETERKTVQKSVGQRMQQGYGALYTQL